MALGATAQAKAGAKAATARRSHGRNAKITADAPKSPENVTANFCQGKPSKVFGTCPNDFFFGAADDTRAADDRPAGHYFDVVPC